MTAILHENVMTNNWQIFYKPGYDCCPNARWLFTQTSILSYIKCTEKTKTKRGMEWPYFFEKIACFLPMCHNNKISGFRDD